MTEAEVTELFIKAAETDRRLPNTERPARLKSMNLPIIHTAADQAGWGGERYQEERSSFWDESSTRLSQSAVTEWERANTLIVLVDRDADRRCLWHWAMSKAPGGKPFSRWCREREHISAWWGNERRKRAIAQIAASLARKATQNGQNATVTTLRPMPEISDKTDSIEASHPLFWRADGAFNPVFMTEGGDFSFHEAQNRRRREKRQRAA